MYEGRFSTFEPITFLDRSEITVIRPMIFIDENDIVSYSKELPVVFNPCPADKHTQREYVKNLIKSIKKDVPISRDRMLSAIYNPDRNHLFDDAIDKLKEQGYYNEQ